MGRDVPDRRRAGRARGARLPGRVPPGRVPPARRRAGRTSRPPAPSCSRPCVALIAHPDDERYQHLFGTTVTLAAVRRRDPRPRAPRRRAGQGRRHRDVLHLRRPDRRAVVARAAAADPLGRRAATAASLRETPGRGSPTDAGPRRALTPSSPARRRSRAREAVVDALRAAGDLDGEPGAHAAQGELLREGRQAARDRHLPPVVHPQRRPRGAGRDLRAELLARGEELDFHPDFMRVRYENWVSGLNGDWLISPAALLRRADPGLVPAGRRTASRTTTHPHRCRPRTSCRRPVVATCRPATPTTSAACPAGSSATPTSWTPGRRAR